MHVQPVIAAATRNTVSSAIIGGKIIPARITISETTLVNISGCWILRLKILCIGVVMGGYYVGR